MIMLLLLLLSISVDVYGAAYEELTGATLQLYEAVIKRSNSTFKEIECAVKAGADIRAVQGKFKPYHDELLAFVTLDPNEQLLKLLIEKGMKVQGGSWASEPILSVVSDISITAILLQAGASQGLTKRDQYNVLSSMLWDNKGPAWIELYRTYDFFDVNIQGHGGFTLLMTLARWPQKLIIAKAEALLKNLSYEERKSFINKKDIHGKTVFKIIAKWKKVERTKLAYLNEYEQYLRKQLEEPIKEVVQEKEIVQKDVNALFECAICYESLRKKESKQKIICCSLDLCKECYRTCKSLSSKCPQCAKTSF